MFLLARCQRFETLLVSERNMPLVYFLVSHLCLCIDVAYAPFQGFCIVGICGKDTCHL